MIEFHGFPQLFTARLLLRKIEPEDIPSLLKYADNKKISDEIVSIPYPYREPDAAMRMGSVWRQFKAGTGFVFAIILKESNELIGEAAIHLLDKNKPHGQVAYWIGEPLWGQGYASEAVQALGSFAFEKLNLDLMYGDCHDYNQASIEVLKKNGFSRHSQSGSLLVYSLKKEDYKAIP